MDMANIDEKRLKKLTEIIKAIANPTRIKLLCCLKSGTMNVTELEESLGANQAQVSQQLKILRLNNLVSVERTGGFAYYSLSTEKEKALVMIMDSLCKLLLAED